MKKFKPVLILLFLVTSVNLYSQYSKFNLSDYKLPEIKVNRLDFTIDLNTGLSEDIHVYSVNDTISLVENSLQGYVNLAYFNYKNYSKYQGGLNASLSILPDLYTSKLISSTTKDNSNMGRLNISSSNRFFNNNNFFLEVNPSASLFTHSSKNYSSNGSNSADISEKVLSVRFNTPIGVGYGRVEPVQDARLAIYIIEELNKAGIITEIPSDSFILFLAQEISKIKAERFFDARIKKEKELRFIDSILVANDIISDKDIIYFSILNDQWDYAATPYRGSGFRTSLGIINNLLISNQHSIQTSDDIELFNSERSLTEHQVGAYIDINYEKPINLYWQSKSSLRFNFYNEKTRNPDDLQEPISNFEGNHFEIDAELSIQYLPNTRTWIYFGLNGFWSSYIEQRALIDIDIIDFEISSRNFGLDPEIEISYYFSPQLRLELSTSIRHINYSSLQVYENNYDDENSLWKGNSFYTRLKFTYSLF